MSARDLYRCFEPLHAVTYFSPQAAQAYQDAGLTGYWRGYFAGRTACLGASVPASTVTALFNTFAPGMVERAVPGVWERISPEAALAARLAGATAALAALDLDREQVGTAAEVAVQAARAAALDGRALGAAEAAQPWPADDLGRLWRAATVLREVRGDGHVAALVTHGLTGLEAVVLRCARDLDRSVLQPARGWSDEEWDAAAERLRTRGLVGDDGAATEAAVRVQAAVEEATDRLAAQPWEAVGDEAAAAFEQAAAPMARAAFDAYLAPMAGLGLGAPERQ